MDGALLVPCLVLGQWSLIIMWQVLHHFIPFFTFTQTNGSYDDNLRYGHYGVIESAILIIKIWYAFPGLVH